MDNIKRLHFKREEEMGRKAGTSFSGRPKFKLDLVRTQSSGLKASHKRSDSMDCYILVFIFLF